MKELRWDSNLAHAWRQTCTWSITGWICFKATSWYTETEVTGHNCSRRNLDVFPSFHNYYFCLFFFYFSPPTVLPLHFRSLLLALNHILLFLPFYLPSSLSFFFSLLVLLYFLFSYLSFIPSLLSYFFLHFSDHSYFILFCSPPCLCWYHIYK